MSEDKQEPEKLSDVPANALKHANKKLQEMDPLQPEASAMDMQMVGVAWVAVGFLVAHLDIRSVPWLTLLGWVLMAIGAFTVVMATLANGSPKE